MQRVDRLPGFGADLVGEGERHAITAPSADDVQDDRAVGAPAAAPPGSSVMARLVEQARTTDLDRRRRRRRAVTPTAGHEVKSVAADTVSVTAARGLDDGAGQRMLGIRLGRRGQGEHLASVSCRVRRRWPVTVGSPLVSVPVLSNSTVSTVRIRLQRQPVLDQDAAAGGAFGGDRDDQRDRQAEGVRAGDHQHGDGPHHGLVRVPDEAPDDGGDERRAQRDVEQPAAARSARRCARDEEFCASVDQALDAGQRGVVADRGHLEPGARSRSPRCRRRHCRRRCARDGRDSPVTIDSSTSAAPSTIRPSAGTLPPGRTSTTSSTRSSAGATVTARAIAVDALGLVGQQCRERVQRRRRLRQRPHLDPVAEQHDHDEQREFPPEVELVSSTPRLAPHEETNATVIAKPISSIIPGARERISLTAPVRNGRPPHRYITVPINGDTQGDPGKLGTS